MQRCDWAQQARRQSGFVHRELHEARRGAYTLYDPDVQVIFGNGGSEGEVAVWNEIEQLRTVVVHQGGEVLAVATLPNGASLSWVLLVRGVFAPEDFEGAPGQFLHELVWIAWIEESGGSAEDILKQCSRSRAIVGEQAQCPQCMN